MTYRIGIGQSRYFLPAAILVGLLFLLAFFWMRQAFASAALGRYGCAVLLAAVLIFNGLNSFAHVVVFPQSPRSRALAIVTAAVKEDPDTLIAVISSPNRSPFELTALAGHVDVFCTLTPPDDYWVQTWDQYLELIAGHFAQSSPRFIVFEEIITVGKFFLPRKYADDLGKRHLYPNPGPAAWTKMLHGLGYERVIIFRQGQGQEWLRCLLGDHYLRTTEGTGAAVCIFERSREAGTDPGQAVNRRVRLVEPER
jgi:hypothetical protein